MRLPSVALGFLLGGTGRWTLAATEPSSLLSSYPLTQSSADDGAHSFCYLPLAAAHHSRQFILTAAEYNSELTQSGPSINPIIQHAFTSFLHFLRASDSERVSRELDQAWRSSTS